LSDKPEVLQESRFIVREGLPYRACRTGAIWMNKLFFGCVVLLGIWLLYGGATGNTGCVDQLDASSNVTGTRTLSCNVFLHPTSMYLGAMAVVSFVLSIAFGALGLVFGKQVLEAARAEDEVGAQRPPT
jgi:hypothetical protein